MWEGHGSIRSAALYLPRDEPNKIMQGEYNNIKFRFELIIHKMRIALTFLSVACEQGLIRYFYALNAKILNAISFLSP